MAESLIEEFKKISVENLRILLPRASGARDILAIELENQGALVDDVPVYQTVGETEDVAGGIKRFREEGADMITFTSGSTATHFQALVEKQKIALPRGLAMASIGPVTSTVMENLGMVVGLEAPQHDIPGLVQAISDFYKNEI